MKNPEVDKADIDNPTSVGTTAGILTEALARTAAAHGAYEAEVLNGVYDDDWPQWYAQHMARTLADDGYRLTAA
jgi:hypothetical protein